MHSCYPHDLIEKQRITKIIRINITNNTAKSIQLYIHYTRIEFFRKNYREIHGNRGIPNFLGIFTVFTVIFTGIHGNFYRDNSKNSRKFGYSLITVNFTVVFPEKFYPRRFYYPLTTKNSKML